MLGECQVKVKSQSELDIGGRETCPVLFDFGLGWAVLGLGTWTRAFQYKRKE